MIYDVVVVGLGAAGAAALYELSQIPNLKVLGVDSYQVPHLHSSHGGFSRIIRKAYFEHPDYVPLLQEAYNSWVSLEKKFQQTLFHSCGVLYVGNQDHNLISGVRRAAELYHIHIEEYNQSQLKNKFPMFKLNSQEQIIFEPEAGWVDVNVYLNTILQNCQHSQCQLLFNEPLIDWNESLGTYHLQTKNHKIQTQKVIFSNGPSMNKTLPFLQNYLITTKQVYSWFEPANNLTNHWKNMPCWCVGYSDLENIFYGLPNEHYNKKGNFGMMKFGFHKTGEVLNNWHDKSHIYEEEKNILKNFINQSFEFIDEGTMNYDTCIYTNSTDQNFIIDYVPNSNKTAMLISACSGHGFKFSPLLGKIAKELIIEGETHYNINLFKLERFLNKIT